MNNSLFTIELPFVSTNEELEKVQAMYSEYDPYFIASGCIKERREKIDKLWQKFKPYTDKHFLEEIKKNFHQRSWEMYIGNVLLSKGLSIKYKNEGPDFIVNDDIYIECVASTRGDPNKPDSVPEMYVARTLEEIQVRDVPVDKMILRITQAIKDKELQYEKWKEKTWFNQKVSFVIAINTGDLMYPQDRSIIRQALFGLKTVKKQKSEVPVDYFRSEKYNFVSGVLFSYELVINHPDNLGDDCIFVNNPFAKNPVNQDFIKKFRNFNNWYSRQQQRY